jgi:hypothetical protein
MTSPAESADSRRSAFRALSRAATLLSTVGGFAAFMAWQDGRWFGSSGQAGLLPSAALCLVFAGLAVHFHRKSKP